MRLPVDVRRVQPFGDSRTLAAIMRETEFWERMRTHLGVGYYQVWAGQHSLAQLDGRTVDEAMTDGIDCKTIWRAVWEALELPARER